MEQNGQSSIIEIRVQVLQTVCFKLLSLIFYWLTEPRLDHPKATSVTKLSLFASCGYLESAGFIMAGCVAMTAYK